LVVGKRLDLDKDKVSGKLDPSGKFEKVAAPNGLVDHPVPCSHIAR
jgi:hypothetical protein